MPNKPDTRLCYEKISEGLYECAQDGKNITKPNEDEWVHIPYKDYIEFKKYIVELKKRLVEAASKSIQTMERNFPY